MTDPDPPGPLAFARRLVDSGVPVFVAKHVPSHPKAIDGYVLPASWHTTRCDPTNLDRWRPGDALCAVGGHALDFMDVDPRNGGDVALAALKTDGLLPRSYALVSTPSGGLHFYLARLGVAKCSRDGIDLQAGAPDGTGRGFVFLPGTARPGKTDGVLRTYALVHDHLDAFGADDDSGAGLRTWLGESRPKGSGADLPPGTWSLDGGSDRVGITGLGTPITDNRDDTLSKATARLMKRGSSEEEAWLVMQGRIADVVGGDPRDPFTRKDFDRWWSGAAKKNEFQPVPVDEDADVVELTAHQVAVAREVDRLRVIAEAKALLVEDSAIPLDHPSLSARMVTGGGFVLDAPDGIPAVWGEKQQVLWPKGEALVIAGPPGVGKTTIAHQVVEALLRGGHVLGLPVEAAEGRILYLACDRPAQIARALRRRLGEYPRELLDSRLLIWRGPPPGDFAKTPELLTALCKAAGASVVIIDSLKDVAIGLSEDPVGAGLNLSRQNAIAAGIDVLELHHVVKRGENGSAPTRLADLYGSAWIPAGAGSVLLVWGEAGDTTVRLSHLKQPGETVGPFTVTHDHAAGTSSIQSALTVLSLAHRSIAGLTVKNAALGLFSSTSDPDKEKARRLILAAVASGDLVLSEAGSRGRGNEAVWLPRCPALAPDLTRCSFESGHGGAHE